MLDNDEKIREKFHNLTINQQDNDDWDPLISIGTVARKVGLSVSALRKYENEGLLIYHRTESGHRLLCRADITRIRTIQRLINSLGLNMEGIRRLLALLPCWQLKPCNCEMKDRCRAISDDVRPCWMVESTECSKSGEVCRECNVYRYGAYCTEVMKTLLHNLDEKNQD